VLKNRVLRGMFVSWREEVRVIRIWRKLHKEKLCSFHSENIPYQHEQIKETHMCGKCRMQSTDKKYDESLSGRQNSRELGVGEMIILK
jgi:hypothetical protein